MFIVTHVISHYRSHAYREPGLVRINDWAWWEGEQFDIAPVEGRDGFIEKPHFSQRTREMGHPAGPKFEKSPRKNWGQAGCSPISIRRKIGERSVCPQFPHGPRRSQ
jgi:hypothetical protein